MNNAVYIVVLNWNGWQDTIECLESIQQLDHPHYRIVLLDNGSTDGSLEQINAWAVGKNPVESRFVKYRKDNKGIHIVHYDRATAENGGTEGMELKLSQLPSSRKLVIVDNKENLGFAAGCNVGIRYALAAGAEYIWLLNNDTVVERDALSKLLNTLELNDKYQGMTPQIRLYDDPMKTWNCGGHLTRYGARKYCYANENVNLVPKHGSEKRTFVTGCALLVRASVFRRLGLLTERFFLGEEDFEFSQRLKIHGYEMACRYDAIIYHKVSASLQGASSIGRTYIYYLCRFINMRHCLSPVVWHVWRWCYYFHIIPMLMRRHKIHLFSAFRIITNVSRDSTKLEEVDKETFESYLGLNVE